MLTRSKSEIKHLLLTICEVHAETADLTLDDLDATMQRIDRSREAMRKPLSSISAGRLTDSAAISLTSLMHVASAWRGYRQ